GDGIVSGYARNQLRTRRNGRRARPRQARPRQATGAEGQDRMEMHIVADAEAGAKVVADVFTRTLQAAGDTGAVLGLATGSSPVPAYEELIRRHREDGLSFARSRAFLLDEYVGLPAGHEQSYHRFIRENFTSHVDIDDAAVVSPDGTAVDPVAEAASYDRRLQEAGGVDLQILGIGSNGHI